MSTSYENETIERLAKRITELEAAILPFARYAAGRMHAWTARNDSAYYGQKHDISINVTYGDFKRCVTIMGLKTKPAPSGKNGKPLIYGLNVHAYIRADTLAWLDANRGDLSRSAYLREILQNYSSRARYKHKKRQSVVRIWGVAEVQTSTPIVEGDRVVVYVHEGDNIKWVRLESEFHDGRFMTVGPDGLFPDGSR